MRMHKDEPLLLDPLRDKYIVEKNRAPKTRVNLNPKVRVSESDIREYMYRNIMSGDSAPVIDLTLDDGHDHEEDEDQLSSICSASSLHLASDRHNHDSYCPSPQSYHTSDNSDDDDVEESLRNVVKFKANKVMKRYKRIRPPSSDSEDEFDIKNPIFKPKKFTFYSSDEDG